MAKFSTQEEMARAGGNALKKKYGKKYFKNLVNKRWEKQKAKDEEASKRA